MDTNSARPTKRKGQLSDTTNPSGRSSKSNDKKKNKNNKSKAKTKVPTTTASRPSTNRVSTTTPRLEEADTRTSIRSSSTDAKKKQSDAARTSKRTSNISPTKRVMSLFAVLRAVSTSFVHYVKKAFRCTGEAFAHALTKAMRIISKTLIRLLRFVFYPIVVITRGVRTITKGIAKMFFAHWKRIFAVLFLILAFIVSVDEYKLAEWAGHSIVQSDNAGTLLHSKVQLVHSILQQHFTTPLLTFISVGLPQLTYELLRVWHFVLADGAMSMLDLMVAGLRLSKVLLPSALHGLMDWKKLESLHFAKRLHDARSADIQQGDPLLKSYLNAQHTMLRKQKHTSDALHKAGWSKASRKDLDRVWEETVKDTQQSGQSAYKKYIEGDVKRDKSNVQTLTLSQAFDQLKSSHVHTYKGTKAKRFIRPVKVLKMLKPVSVHKKTVHRRMHFAMHTKTHKTTTHPETRLEQIIDAVPEKKRLQIVQAYQKGARAFCSMLFQQPDPNKVTVQNLSHLYFGAVALSGTSSGVVEGIRAAFFKQARTGAMVKLGVKMKAVEEVVPVCFYLDE